MRRRLPPIVVAALLVALVPSAASASVATSCSFDSGTATVTAVIGSGDDPTLVRNGDAIEFGALACGAATVTNTDSIAITDPDPGTGESLTISLAGGRLVPGKTPEDDGTDEIEMSVAQSFPGSLALVGSDVADHFYVCTGDINLNENVSGDSEIFAPTTTTVTTVAGGKGNDVLRTKMWESVVSGGEGDDVLYPMDFGPSAYDGGPGNDELSYESQGFTGSTGDIHALGGGAATIDRGSNVSDSAQGFETFRGFDGPTKFYGSPDADHFIGGKANDWFLPMGGNDIVDGGPAFAGIGDYDLISAGASASPVVFDMDAGTMTGEGADTFTDVELLQGSPEGDTFTGDPTDAPVIQIDGYGGHDVLDFSHGVANGQTVFLGPDTPTSALWAIGIAEVIGSPFRDRFVFTSGDVPASFDGGRGNDRLVGGPLDDTLIGDRGADRVIGKGGIDTCPDGPGADTVTGCELP